MNIKGLSAVITGAASGLGEATARMLASLGAKVAIFDVDEERGAVVADETHGVFSKVDITNENSVVGGFDTAVRANGPIRILVNCAGVALGQKTTDGSAPHSLADFQRVIAINLAGTFNCIRIAATRMAMLDQINHEERGVIINT